MSSINPILVVDDDTKLLKLLKDFLEKDGLPVLTSSSAEEALEVIKYVIPSICILDVMMPGMNGFELLETLRVKENISIPIIMLSAMGDTEDRIRGLKLGVDDYIVKPFNPDELLLKIRNMLKRHYPVNASNSLNLGDVTINLATGEINHSNGEVKILSQAEKQLIILLANNMGKAVSREDMFKTLQTTTHIENENSIAVHILRLRNKIELDKKRPYLKTLRGNGYMLISYK